MPAWLGAAAPSIIGALSGVFSDLFRGRQEKKAYRNMRDYNTPKAQMSRFTDAGLSPYLMYSQGNSGNVSSPSPVQSSDVGGHIGKGLDEYMSISNFDVNQRLMWADKHLKDQAYRIGGNQEEITRMDAERKILDMYADFPKWIYDRMDSDLSRGVGDTGFRNKMNELKLAASKATTDRIKIAIQNMNYKNEVDRVRAGYARDYGMVGGDWTQGFGLLKSLPSFFKRSAKAGKVIPGGKSLPPWRSTIKTNPIAPRRKSKRVGGFPKGGFTRP